MAVKFRCHVVLLVGLLVSVLGHAEQSNTPPVNQHLAEQEIARLRLTKAVIELEQKSEECEALRIVLPHDLLADVDLPKEGLKTALFYFHARAENQCVKVEANEYVVASLLMVQLMEQVDGAAGGRPDISRLVTDDLLNEIEKKAEYLALSQEVRQRLEAIVELQRPFDLLKSARSVGLLEAAPEQ